MTSAETRAPVSAGTVFQAASLSKPVVAYAALLLADAGLLDLDRPLGSYLPEPYAAGDPRIRSVTARQALSHSTGMQNWRFSADDTLQFAFAPGGGFQYSGEGYFYLSNRYTLAQIFKRDLMTREALAARARHNVEMIVHALAPSTPARLNRIVKT